MLYIFYKWKVESEKTAHRKIEGYRSYFLSINGNSREHKLKDIECEILELI